jgi:hypothetical protein
MAVGGRAGLQVCNNGTVSAGTFDPNTINNSAGACIGKK